MQTHSTSADAESVRLQIGRIIQSECFRSAESMRNLLGFLAAKLLAGDADHLKEYSIGVDGLGKPPSYDPRSDSTVRVQIGRLRQKLGEYYRSEGALDALLIEIPKGHLHLAYKSSSPSVGVSIIEGQRALPAPAEIETARVWRRRSGILAGVAAAAMVLAAGLGILLWREVQRETPAETPWTPDLEQLWRPFLVQGRPVNISFEAPMFLQMGNPNQLFRDTTVNRLATAAFSPAVTAVGKALHVTQLDARYHYAPFQEVNSAFLLGKLLAGRKPQTFLVRSSRVSWEQMANNNWVFIGSPAFFSELLNESPIERQFAVEASGVRNIHPRAGESSFFKDQHSMGTSPPLGFSEDGNVYAVVTQGLGPSANSNVLSFESNITSARLGAVQWFTDMDLGAKLVARLQGSGGKLPRYYQVVLRVKYKDSIPIESAYVAHRELQLTRPASPEKSP
jgi:hypothetical protein